MKRMRYIFCLAAVCCIAGCSMDGPETKNDPAASTADIEETNPGTLLDDTGSGTPSSGPDTQTDDTASGPDTQIDDTASGPDTQIDDTASDTFVDNEEEEDEEDENPIETEFDESTAKETFIDLEQE